MSGHDGAALSGAPTTASATSRQQPLPINPRRAVRSPLAAFRCDGGGTAVREAERRSDGRSALRAPPPLPAASVHAHNDAAAVGGRLAT